jgi:hypothetical protein
MVLCDTGAQDDMGAQAPKCQGEAAFACRSATGRGVSAMLRQRVLPVVQLTGRTSKYVSNRQKPRQEKGRFPTFCEAFAFSGDALEGPLGGREESPWGTFRVCLQCTSLESTL